MLTTLAMIACLTSATQTQEMADYPIQPVPFTDVHIADTFWAPRQETNRSVTIPYCFQKCEETGRIDNFAKAAGMMDGPFEGIRFNDSDVVKVVEGAAYALMLKPDPALDKYLDDLIAKIAGAQEDDGYLFTCRTINAKKLPGGAGDTRWSNLKVSHELYNIGHMYEAAVAHYQATGKRTLLDVAIKSADLVDRVFGPDGIRSVPGHQEIEIGLAKLYRVTGERRYLDLAKFFLDERGQTGHGRDIWGDYCQDHVPVVQQREAVGHAVRAAYMYSGMADIAALTGDAAYIKAMDAIWADVVTKKLYITGGIGAQRHGEAFGKPYELPNATAYNETCAAIANILWNHRMFLLHGDSKYIDVLERTLYNGFLSGISFTGNTFFYPNPLASDGVTGFNHGAASREPWFGCSCCPVNVARFVASLAGYAYAQRDDVLFVNLFATGKGQMQIGENKVTLAQATGYPWKGDIKLTVTPAKPAKFALALRIPGWATGSPVPSDLYQYVDAETKGCTLKVNGQKADYEVAQGYAVIRRAWKKGDTVELALPMPIRRVLSHDKVNADKGRVALERGPIVYCLEQADNGEYLDRLALPDDVKIRAHHEAGLLHGVTVIEGKALAKSRSTKGGSETVSKESFKAVPYYAWNHRGEGEMLVWLPRDSAMTSAPPIPTIASTSKATASHAHNAVKALSDQIEPENSIDHSIPRFTWWDHKGTTEWVQYDFQEAADVSSVSVYWFDDTGRGSCRTPKSWKLLYKAGDEWKEVDGAPQYGVKLDQCNVANFTKVKTTALRIVVELQPKYSGGILEWRVE